MNVGDWAELLALREAAGSKAHFLAYHIRRHGWGSAMPLPTPQPTEAHRHLAQRQVAALLRLDLTVVPVHELPPHLAQAHPMPVALFVRGAAELLHRLPAVAVVGARRAGPRGCAWARQLACALAHGGSLIISGGAMGVDGAAHQGALDARAPTVVYMGTAIDRAYPHHNLPLFSRVLQQGGALVSEHPPYAKTFKSSHALRNRLIAAHCERLVVVEAALASGTLGAVRFARRLGRQVFVAPEEVGGEREGLQAILAEGWGQVWPGR